MPIFFNELNNEWFFFYSLSIIAIIASIFVIISKNPVQSVLYLVLAFFSSSCILLLLELEFIAMTIFIVYIGAIAVLFLFVVMLLQLKEQTFNLRANFYYNFLVFLFIFLFFFKLITVLFEFLNLSYFFYISENLYQNFDYLYYFSLNNIDIFGFFLYNDYFIVFLFSGVVLLIAMLGAILLTLEDKGITRKFNIDFENRIHSDITKSIFLLKNKNRKL